MIKLNRTQKFQVFLPYKKIAKPLEVMGSTIKTEFNNKINFQILYLQWYLVLLKKIDN